MQFPVSISGFEKAARQVLVKDEGIRYYPYKDSKGNWTIGVGHYIGTRLEEQHLDMDACMYFLHCDIANHLDDLHDDFGEAFYEALPRPRQMALLSLAFTMKRQSLESFVNLKAAALAGDWDKAAEEVLNSKWSKDVDPKQNPDGRDNRVAFMLKTGRFHPDYDL
jgi:lysozyme